MIPSRTLPRAERLRTLGAIRRLFESGESGFVYPFRYVWFAEADDRMSAEVLFSVPKKFHKRAKPAQPSPPPGEGGLPAQQGAAARGGRKDGCRGRGADLLLEGDRSL